jgi:hypothetical protein
MSLVYEYEYTDTFSGEANYSWVKRGKVYMPELTHYGFDGQNGYTKANRSFERVLMTKVKAALGLTGVRGEKVTYGDTIEFTPYRSNTIVFITLTDE